MKNIRCPPSCLRPHPRRVPQLRTADAPQRHGMLVPMGRTVAAVAILVLLTGDARAGLAAVDQSESTVDNAPTTASAPTRSLTTTSAKESASTATPSRTTGATSAAPANSHRLPHVRGSAGHRTAVVRRRHRGRRPGRRRAQVLDGRPWPGSRDVRPRDAGRVPRGRHPGAGGCPVWSVLAIRRPEPSA